MAAKLVYWFEEGGEEHRQILGGKGAGLAEMTRIELPVPPGFTVTTEACKVYYQSGNSPDSLKSDIEAFIKGLEGKTGKNFGGTRTPCWCPSGRALPLACRDDGYHPKPWAQ